MNSAQFNVLAALMRCRNSPLLEATRLHMVYGATQTAAAAQYGVYRTNVVRLVTRLRKVQALVLQYQADAPQSVAPTPRSPENQISP